MDELTGLPRLPKNQFWRVIKKDAPVSSTASLRDSGQFQGWRTAFYVQRVQTVTYEAKIKRFLSKPLIKQRTIDSVMSSCEIPGNLLVLNEKAIRDTAATLFQDDETRRKSLETNQRLLGDYPPKVLTNKKENGDK